MSPTRESIESLKHAPGVAGMLEPILHRWSPRAYADRDVPVEDLKKGFEAARWAASSFNEQPWRFIVGHRGDATYQKILDSLVPFNQDWAKHAPVLVLSVARKHFAHNGQINRHSWHDTGAAMANFMVQITALGLHAHSMAGFDHEKAQAVVPYPGRFRDCRRYSSWLSRRSGVAAGRTAQVGAIATPAQGAEGVCLLRMGEARLLVS